MRVDIVGAGPAGLAVAALLLAAPFLSGCLSCPDDSERLTRSEIGLDAVLALPFTANGTNEMDVGLYNSGPEAARIDPPEFRDGLGSIWIEIVGPNQSRIYSYPGHADTPCGPTYRQDGCNDLFLLQPGTWSNTTLVLNGDTIPDFSWEIGREHVVRVGYLGRCEHATWRGGSQEITVTPS